MTLKGLFCLFLLASVASGALIAYYPLNEGTGDDIYDWSGNGYDGVIDNHAYPSQGWTSNAIVT